MPDSEVGLDARGGDPDPEVERDLTELELVVEGHLGLDAERDERDEEPRAAADGVSGRVDAHDDPGTRLSSRSRPSFIHE